LGGEVERTQGLRELGVLDVVSRPHLQGMGKPKASARAPT